MEWTEKILAWAAGRAVELAAGWTATFTVVVLLGTILFGRNYKKRFAALEARFSMPAITQTFNFNAVADARDNERQLRNAVEAKTSQNLKETIKCLPEHPLGDGHTYARLPDGTNIVTMADGSIQLALPVRIAANIVSGGGSMSVGVIKVTPPEHEKPDDG